jgi:hypothetical protein
MKRTARISAVWMALLLTSFLLVACGDEPPKPEAAPQQPPAPAPAPERETRPASQPAQPSTPEVTPQRPKQEPSPSPAAEPPTVVPGGATPPATKPSSPEATKPASGDTRKPDQPVEEKPAAPPAAPPQQPAAAEPKAAVRDVIFLTGSPMGRVRLDHKLHAQRAGNTCTTCHHPSRQQKPATAPQQACSDCHTKTPSPPMKTRYQAAFHNPTAQSGTCIDCHKAENAKGKKAPLKCAECHRKDTK